MIKEDDGDMIVQMVQDHTSEDFENVVHYKNITQEELADMK